MSVVATVNKSMSVGGQTFNESSSPSGDAFIVQNVSVPAAEEGVLSTRTDADTGVITLDDSGHTISALDRVDVYWAAGKRCGMSASVVSGSLVTVDGGAGNDLPTVSTTVYIAKAVLTDVNVLGTDAVAILLASSQRGQFAFVDDADGEALQLELGANKAWSWTDDSGILNPITGDQIVGVYVSNGGTVAATMKVGVVHNN